MGEGAHDGDGRRLGTEREERWVEYGDGAEDTKGPSRLERRAQLPEAGKPVGR